MLMPNLYGNIISNIACGLVGGAGLVSGRNIGDHYAVFETVPVHFSIHKDDCYLVSGHAKYGQRTDRS